jgi:transcriptional regulator with PAS, ATPase and Fis domain
MITDQEAEDIVRQAFRKLRRAEESRLTLDTIKRRAVLDALDRHGGNKPAAAAELGISLKTVYNILNREPGNAPGCDA